jgi:hypothetical protein
MISMFNLREVLIAVLFFAYGLTSVLAQSEGHSDVLSNDWSRLLYNEIDPDAPGFGVTDYPGNLNADIPKSYAMVLLAEVERTQNGLNPDLKSLANVAGEWLLENLDSNKDGVVGWGVPIAWDAYGDGSVNPADTEYTISTAIVIDALLTWMEKDPEAPRSRIMKTVKSSILPFLAQPMRSSTGMAPYSFMLSDRQYNTYNPASYLAGQLQRYSIYVEDETLARRMQAVADDTVEALLANAQINVITGSVFWWYSKEENITNDLAHAAYIVHGLRSYIEYDGKLSGQIPIDDVVEHLGEFYDGKRNSLRAWPNFETKVDRPARSYGLGMAMSLLCSDQNMGASGFQFRGLIPQYQDEKGTILRHPQGFELYKPIHINEYRNYLYRGIVACDVWQQTQLPTNIHPIELKPLPKSKAPAPAETASLHPLKMLPAGISPNQPVAIELFSKTGNEKTWSVLRETITDTIFVDYKSYGQSIRIKFSPNPHTRPIFRGAAGSPNRLDLVYFDNVRQANFLVSFVQKGETLVSLNEPVRLPSFEDPAGGTYEMIPKVFVHKPTENVTHVAAGPILVELTNASITATQRMDSCSQIIEAVWSDAGHALLCRDMKATSSSQVYSIRVFGSVEMPVYAGVYPVFDLKLKDDQLTFKLVKDAASLSGLLDFELRQTMQGGWMQFGISNRESRVPWDQIYYLNGLLDLLSVASNHGEMDSLITPFRKNIRNRLIQESAILSRHWQEGRFKTVAFSVDRSKQLFSVQTSRLLLLLERMRIDPMYLSASDTYFDLHEKVHCLEDHIEVLSLSPQPIGWMPRKTPYLKWPRSSAFYFDGINVPFNHQNEWAYSIQSTPRSTICPESSQAAKAMLEFFMMRETFSGRLPAHGVWKYWWGQAYDGWGIDDGLSRNMVQYGGDHITAWTSFKSIDVMSILSLAKSLPAPVRSNLIASAKSLLSKGKLYPFVNQALVELGEPVTISQLEAMKYARAAASWELQNMSWALLYYADLFSSRE